MRSSRMIKVVLSLFVSVSLFTTGADARPLPVFHVTTSDGAVLASSDLCKMPHCAILYVRPDDAQTPGFLTRVAQVVPVKRRPRALHLVLAGSPEDAKALVETLSARIPGVAFSFDPSGAARDALKLSTFPAVVMLDRGRIAGTVVGSRQDLRYLAGW
jgi:hypothetical protein